MEVDDQLHITAALPRGKSLLHPLSRKVSGSQIQFVQISGKDRTPSLPWLSYTDT
jgi:hypothetical protein